VAVAVLNGAVGVPVTSAATIRAGTRSMPCELIAWPFASRQRLLCGGGHEEATEFCEPGKFFPLPEPPPVLLGGGFPPDPPAGGTDPVLFGALSVSDPCY
jgi:hypothetical protein